MTKFIISTDDVSCPSCNNSSFRLVGKSIDFEYYTCQNEFIFVQCLVCSCTYIKNRPTNENLSVIYPPHYHNYSPTSSINFVYKVKNFIDSWGFKKTLPECATSFLDVGCSSGRMLSLAKKNMPPNSLIEGIEITEEAAKSAIMNGFKVHIGSVDNISLHLNNYDFVYMQQVIEHLSNPRAALENLYLAMKKGGKLVVETPTNESLDYKIFKKRYWGGYHCPRHFVIFNSESLVNLAHVVGFCLVKVKYKPQPVHWIWTLHHYLKDKSYPNWIVSRFHMTNTFLVVIFTLLEFLLLFFRFKSSNMSIVLQK